MAFLGKVVCMSVGTFVIPSDDPFVLRNDFLISERMEMSQLPNQELHANQTVTFCLCKQELDALHNIWHVSKIDRLNNGKN